VVAVTGGGGAGEAGAAGAGAGAFATRIPRSWTPAMAEP
jgi:hypothetical protein